MILKNNYSVAGKFKFDIYSKEGNLKNSIYSDNFITPTGLSFLNNFAYADCFRYLSLGSGTAVNSVKANSVGTTGLSQPLWQYAYIGGNTEGMGCSDGSESNQYVSQGCSYRIDPTGVVLSRAWRVPVDQNSFFSGPYLFKEYMLSPGQPGLTGYLDDGFGGYVFGQACGCQTAAYPLPDGQDVFYGKESPDFAFAYPAICKSYQAFTRIIKDVPVGYNEYLVVNYALTINLSGAANTVKPFRVNVSRNSPVSAAGMPASFLAANWVTASGISSLVHPGIKLINNGDILSVDSVNQLLDPFNFRAGESFVPPLGIAMEPSCPIDNRISYLSNDNLQFVVNDKSGGYFRTETYKPDNAAGANFPSGTLTFHSNYINETSNNNTQNLGQESRQPYFYRIRTDAVDTFGPNYALQTDYRTPANSSDLTDSVIHDGSLAFVPTYFSPATDKTSSVFNTSLNITGRQREKTVTFSFKTNSTIATGEPIRAFVYGYRYLDGGDNNDWFANMDSIFYPTGASSYSSFDTATHNYGSPLAIVQGAGSKGYYYLDSTNALNMQIKLSWSSPCPPSVDGC